VAVDWSSLDVKSVPGRCGPGREVVLAGREWLAHWRLRRVAVGSRFVGSLGSWIEWWGGVAVRSGDFTLHRPFGVRGPQDARFGLLGKIRLRWFGKEATKKDEKRKKE